MLLHKQDPAWHLPKHWESGTRSCADAFVHLWDGYGQFGQFVDTQSGEIIVGGSASAGLLLPGWHWPGSTLGRLTTCGSQKLLPYYSTNSL